MRTPTSPRHLATALAITLIALPPGVTHAVTFNFTNGGGVPTEIMDAAILAGDLWSAHFTDNITLNITINYSDLGTSPGNSSIFSANYPYADVRTGLLNDAVTASDLSSSSALQAGPSTIFLINRTTTGALRMDTGTAGTFADTNNVEVIVPRAVEKALGLIDENASGTDGTVTLNSNLSYDGDRSDGIDGASYDLIGVIAHELGHVLGFQSVAETISSLGNITAEGNAKPRIGDLFRFSTESTDENGTFGLDGADIGVFDISADNRAKYFSVDGGLTPVTEFARGSSSVGSGFGNGQQANHWLNNTTPVGIMDPTIGLGEELVITAIDIQFFDVIGFNPVPEPAGWAAGGLVTAWALARHLRSRRTPTNPGGNRG